MEAAAAAAVWLKATALAAMTPTGVPTAKAAMASAEAVERMAVGAATAAAPDDAMEGADKEETFVGKAAAEEPVGDDAGDAEETATGGDKVAVEDAAMTAVALGDVPGAAAVEAVAEAGAVFGRTAAAVLSAGDRVDEL